MIHFLAHGEYMFTEDDVNFVNEYLKNERKLQINIFRFHVGEPLTKLEVLIGIPGVSLPPQSRLGCVANVDDPFNLKRVWYEDGQALAEFAFRSQWMLSENSVYSTILTFDKAARNLIGFREFVAVTGIGKQRKVKLINNITNLDPLFGSW